ncbi:lipopolysaccharide transport periplasmic protein LptA [Aquabacterium sp. UBA2148]|uniref:lipopolysaccharide transport periplasmic protein LptA n=1 Tax=Aquabacterium sp. UBA2148 TaxID=1946042 RepID=UPI0025800266|nr:lipopolysaccharide transport periplasmic protein LptA [Aquabacterium sp. UBA2148]
MLTSASVTALARPLARALAASLVVAGVVSAPVAQAEKADRTQPLHFAADSARVEEGQRLNVLTGNVDITKGTMAIRADRVEIRQTPDGAQSATATGGQGGRSYFKQKRDGVEELIEGEAEKIFYDGRDDTVHFTGRAVMRRIVAGVASDEVNGQAIRYDNKTGVYQVMGGGPLGGASTGRVRGVISPRGGANGAAAPSPTPASSAAPTAPAAPAGGR